MMPSSDMPGRIYDQPMPDIMMRTVWFEDLPVECVMNPGNERTEPFPILSIGNYFSLYPTMKQLAQLRDAITKFLESAAEPANAAAVDAIEAPHA